ncbi:MAG: hypothetical protein KDE47_17345, partial [Caldilineaceae bacterium]|nr:hypothetical protein [Caldilineaceae bacterium]
PSGATSGWHALTSKINSNIKGTILCHCFISLLLHVFGLIVQMDKLEISRDISQYSRRLRPKREEIAKRVTHSVNSVQVGECDA